MSEFEWEKNAKYKKEFDHSVNRTSQMVTIPRGYDKKKYDLGWLLYHKCITLKQYYRKLKKLNKEYGRK